MVRRLIFGSFYSIFALLTFVFVFVGIDIDWEYPGYEDHSGTPQDRDNFKLLLNDVRAKLDELGALTGTFYGLTGN